MVVDFDLDGDGKVTEEEINRKERMLEIELREEKAESQKKMAWVAMLMMIGLSVYLFTPMVSDTRVQATADLLGLFLYCTNRCSSCLHGCNSLYGW